MNIRQSFLPIITTFSVTSGSLPLENCLKDPGLLSKAFLGYREKVGLTSFPIMWDSHSTAEAFGCKLGFKEREAYVAEYQPFPPEGQLQEFRVPHGGDSERVQVILKAVKAVARHASEGEPLIANTTAPFTAATKIFGVENLLLKLWDAPKQVMIILHKITDFILSYSDRLIEEGADILFVGEPMASPEIISPNMFREFVLPELKRLVEGLRRPTLLHICGNVYPILKDMTETGATLLSLDQRVELKKVREVVGKDVLLGGNLDPVLLLEKSPDEIFRAAQKCFEEGGPDHFVLMPGCTIPPDTPVENIQAMIRAAEEVGGRTSS
jgi:[methyl-Co(III) methanol-specific corrinoid protein]:coenzyme M methyltransferase